MITETKIDDDSEEMALRSRLDTLAQKHAKAIAELDETEEENIKLINALREIRKEATDVSGQNVLSARIMEILNIYLK